MPSNARGPISAAKDRASRMRDGRVLGKPAALVREDLVRQRAHHDQSRRLPKPASQTVALRVCHQVASSRRGPPITCCPANQPFIGAARRSFEEILRVSRTGLDRGCCGSRRRMPFRPFIFAAGRRSMSAGSSQPRTASMKGQLIALVVPYGFPMEALVGDMQRMTRGCKHADKLSDGPSL